MIRIFQNDDTAKETCKRYGARGAVILLVDGGGNAQALMWARTDKERKALDGVLGAHFDCFADVFEFNGDTEEDDN